jgi:hypothetical protein
MALELKSCSFLFCSAITSASHEADKCVCCFALTRCLVWEFRLRGGRNMKPNPRKLDRCVDARTRAPSRRTYRSQIPTSFECPITGFLYTTGIRHGTGRSYRRPWNRKREPASLFCQGIACQRTCCEYQILPELKDMSIAPGQRYRRAYQEDESRWRASDVFTVVVQPVNFTSRLAMAGYVL